MNLPRSINKCVQKSSEQYQFMNKSMDNGTLERLTKQISCIKGKVKEIDHVDNQFQSKMLIK